MQNLAGKVLDGESRTRNQGLVFGKVLGIVFTFMPLFSQAISILTIFAMGMIGLAGHTKRGAGIMGSAMSGGECFLPLMLFMADRLKDVSVPMVVPQAFSSSPASTL
ncbi:hypothetical protein B0T25DRAFT_569400 [Lasiosphaeria hispida]|uniref:Uncharacterized protein n=1 Tax=Lasiosphaeria hispida TaxID=260671 RepID=A0AAJ0HD89_9PEZI|nr:hypothetical protein B0T25DRAFT_569400 [Lasiosphaeria hispida]